MMSQTVTDLDSNGRLAMEYSQKVLYLDRSGQVIRFENIRSKTK